MRLLICFILLTSAGCTRLQSQQHDNFGYRILVNGTVQECSIKLVSVNKTGMESDDITVESAVLPSISR
jgi:hypothetical protein